MPALQNPTPLNRTAGRRSHHRISGDCRANGKGMNATRPSYPLAICYYPPCFSESDVRRADLDRFWLAYNAQFFFDNWMDSLPLRPAMLQKMYSDMARSSCGKHASPAATHPISTVCAPGGFQTISATPVRMRETATRKAAVRTIVAIGVYERGMSLCSNADSSPG